MQNITINMCEKFHYDRLRNDRALGNGKSDNNKKKNNKFRSDWRLVPGSPVAQESPAVVDKLARRLKFGSRPR